MQLDFQKVTYNGDLEDADRESLIELVEKFQDAQEANAAEFEAAKEQVESLEGAFSEYEDAKDDLIGEITEADRFEEVPLTEDELDAADFSKVREWHEFVHDESDTQEADKDFEDMGNPGPTHEDNDDETPEFAKELVDGLSGVSVE